MAVIDLLGKSLIGYGVNRTFDALFSLGGRGRALNNALGRALSKFRVSHPDIMEMILEADAGKLLREELKHLISIDEQPDPRRLARYLAEGDEDRSQRLLPSLNELFLLVKKEAARYTQKANRRKLAGDAMHLIRVPSTEQ